MAKNIEKNISQQAIYDVMFSPVGDLTIIASTAGLQAILWDTKHYDFLENLRQATDDHIIVQTKQQLSEYFQGIRKQFDLPLAPQGTPFQLRAWRELSNIPYATTVSYGEQAAKMGDKNKARAVGMANGQNPISIIVPCHRVIGSNGKLVGFGGGIERKQYLLNLEKKYM